MSSYNFLEKYLWMNMYYAITISALYSDAHKIKKILFVVLIIYTYYINS